MTQGGPPWSRNVEPRRETDSPGFDALPTGLGELVRIGQSHVTVIGVRALRAGSVTVRVWVVLSKW